MTHPEAVDFIRSAVDVAPGAAGAWADLGAGTGTFTRALAQLLGAGGVVLAVDRDRRAVESLRGLAERSRDGARIEAVAGDLTAPGHIPALEDVTLDGVLFGNSLHFLSRPERALGWAGRRIVPGGRVVVIEYEREGASRWVPYPLPLRRLRTVLEAAGLPSPSVTARRPSAYHGEMYCAVARVLPLAG
ncbi:MAG: class I SAM-dependent methyltransferase [Gemmatimonadota bacterium]